MNKLLLKGLFLGFFFPCLGYLVISYLFEFLISMNVMDETTMGIAERRDRTMTLIALCFVILPINYFKGRKHTDVIRGIGLAVLILAGIWIYYFKDSIFIS